MIQAILTDIEGTTSSIRFVHDVLFPYARERMAGFVCAHADEPQVAAAIRAAAAGVELAPLARCGNVWVQHLEEL